MAFSEDDQDTGHMNDLPETDDETLYRLATPTDHSEEGDNLSDEDKGLKESQCVSNKRKKTKQPTKAKLSVKYKRNQIGGQSMKTKRGKLHQGKMGIRKCRENVLSISRSNSPDVPMDENCDRERQFSSNLIQYTKRYVGRASHESLSPPPESRGARGNYSDLSLSGERLFRAPKQKCPKRLRVIRKQTILSDPLSHRATSRAVVGNTILIRTLRSVGEWVRGEVRVGTN